MRKLILVKYASEIFLKGLNKNKFEKKLKDNIRYVLKGLEYEFITDQGRWFIYSEEIEELINRLKRLFGIAELCVVTEIETKVDKIYEEALRELKENGANTFKVETKRADKSFPMNSMEVSQKVGAYILKNTEGLSVDVKNPECRVTVEIRKNTYIYSKKIKGAGGMPYGTNGKTLLMLSGGIDSPVAGYMMARRGVELSCVYYHSHPYTSERAKEKVKELAKILQTYTGNMTLYIVPFTDIQMSIIEKCRKDELTIIMRRFMMRVACEIAEKNGIHSVSTGESIGQVASQTMEGLVVSNDAADRPVFRPLIATDKGDIMDIARNIGTYETSILPYEDCCTIFVPKHPKTKPILREIIKEESILDIDVLVKEAIENMEVCKDLP
ncbi:putative tRNA sulfurtransferase [Clostridium pasteurianum DSM 525 = ATCC 6013]|uniref:Probable tRNA sulfurtransferase n=1 Tax=Clostridium pasteurianum DSM 525 = ATCC 6013 TaxID=1262449 RepID=A0A0H3J5M4_CLOPA|nr:tRNA uracil 4-sulfurtransferase ThiI [Clostridium pasteurianum]AJA46235.1 putative tRNA sulfurtransferase [Clostridium pasteurianum DSM 525 = ATCC 6013]AJA50223.1 putative tRNA sulfurtransferase [Clostridium pasteurianum DSM 525 = ATCC 6013]AOZ73690.1 thiamine biosynthesis protein ThiI [Clostridium pasteurianum DSM 525 = ATCC 6013]AOZ77487.1 thiamine biosynthesis protein ThiI [Clostridium pasteurianum]ELP60820.1 thiamine biosynthesis protein ThiI [Clostridium pasteurianum DSM 525 = ATCC 601